jgi:hypothetical protein
MGKTVTASVLLALISATMLSFGGETDDCQQPEFRAFTSSVSNDQPRYKAENVLDGNLETAWVEGMDGPGIGEWIRVEFVRPWNVTHVGIIPGYAKREYQEHAPPRDRFFANNRVRSATLYLNKGIEKQIELYDFPVMQYFILPNTPLKTFKLRIDAVHPGSQWDDTCISEIRFLGRKTESQKALPTVEEVFSEQPTVSTTFTFTVESEDLDAERLSAQLESHLSELERVGASEEVKEKIRRRGIGYTKWASVGGNIHFLEWLEEKSIVTQIGKRQDKRSHEVLVYQMDLKKARQNKKELCAQFRIVGCDVATNILYGLSKAAIAFKDKEIIRFFIYCPGPDGAGSTNKQDILWEIMHAIPITFFRVLLEQPEEVQQDDIIQSVFHRLEQRL